jgi:hypothetical protein
MFLDLSNGGGSGGYCPQNQPQNDPQESNVFTTRIVTLLTTASAVLFLIALIVGTKTDLTLFFALCTGAGTTYLLRRLRTYFAEEL